MRNAVTGLAMVLTLVCVAGTADAQITTIYDFEGGLDGFAPNGAIPMSSSIGATSGTGSMAVQLTGPGFAGVLTSTVPPALGNPPGVESILFDLTIVEEFTGTFLDLLIVTFGVEPPNPGGIQSQFADFVSIGSLAPGTYTDLEIELDNDLFTGLSFNETYGPSSPRDVSGFQLTASGNAAFLFYVDNIRVVAIPEPASLGVMATALAGCVGLRRRRS